MQLHRHWFRAQFSLCLLLSASTALAAWPHDPLAGNVALCTSGGDQGYPEMISDGTGGAIVVWEDGRTGTNDIYARRMDASGIAQWTSQGVAVCTATGTQSKPVLVSDGAGGVIVAWLDSRSGTADVYAQRISASGVAQWTANGVAVCTATNSQTSLTITSDQAGGAVLVWSDLRGVDSDIYAQRVNASGVSQWTPNGLMVCNATGTQYSPAIVWSGGAAILAWGDERGGIFDDDIYAQRITPVGVAWWAANGIAVGTGAQEQGAPEMAPDLDGGAILVWHDNGSGVSQLVAQRITASGLSLWATGGVDVAASGTTQVSPAVAADGSNGVVISFGDDRLSNISDLYAQRLSAGGTRMWGATGLAVCSSDGDQMRSTIVSDGLGGALLAWNDQRGGGDDLYAQRVSAAGAAQWGSNGVLLSGAGGIQSLMVSAPDLSGGAIFAWRDGRTGGYDIYTQRVEHHGQLGDPAPVIVSVKDTPADQGGRVKLSWNASYLDEDPVFGIFDYRIWRSVPQSLAAGAVAHRGVTDDFDLAAETGQLLVLPNSAQDYAWELVTTQSAATFGSYSLVVDTESDSVAGFNKRTAFMVEARTGTSASSKRWSSAPDSGYSVDNLAPVTPAPFTAQYAGGTASLHWNPNHEADFAGYRLYRGTSAAFSPGPANLVTAQPDTGYADAAGAPYYYKLTAMDVHGNESPVAMIQPTGTLGVDGLAPSLSFAVPYPQPSREGATFRFALPARDDAALELFDAAGRRIAALCSGQHEAGEHTLHWDGRDGAGRKLPPGLYLARLLVGSRTLTRRIVVGS